MSEMTRTPAGEEPDPLGDPAQIVVGALTALESVSLAVRRVRDLHRPSPADDGRCWEDGKPWPCPTRQALDVPQM